MYALGLEAPSTPAPLFSRGPAAPPPARTGGAAPAPSRDAGARGPEHRPRPAGPVPRPESPHLAPTPWPHITRRTCEVQPGRCISPPRPLRQSAAAPACHPAAHVWAPAPQTQPAPSASPRARTCPAGDVQLPRRRQSRHLGAGLGQARCCAPRIQSALGGAIAHARGIQQGGRGGCWGL